MKSGFHNISNEDYHKEEAVGKSDLQLFHRSPAHYRAKEYKEPTPAMIFGAATHTAILQPDLYVKEYAVMPEGVDKRTKRGKEVALEAQANGQIILSFADAGKIGEMRKAIQNHKTASRLIYDEGPTEISGFWVDKTTGLECKCRPDKIISAKNILVDLKTTEDARLEPFMKSLANFKYHQQAYWYLQGVSIITEVEHNDFVVVALEKEPPYAVAVYRVDAAAIYLAQLEIKSLMDKMRECKANDSWPAYSDKIEGINLPEWYYKTAEF